MTDKLLRKRRTAFTLIELLVVIAIIALLLGIIMPALGAAKLFARQAKAMNANKQLMIGYTTYQSDSNGHVMFGYPPALVQGKPFEVNLPSGHTFSTDTDVALPIIRYPGRMASYQQHVWEILYDHVPPPERPQPTDSQGQAWSKLYSLSVFPSFGINATFVGGAIGNEGFIGDQPNRGKHVVFRQGEVRQPSELIVFGDALRRGGGTGDDSYDGYHLITPPHADGAKWHAVGDEIVIDDTGALMGIPGGRYGPNAVIGFFDGHVDDMSAEELDDMRIWRNDAEDKDDDY